MILILLMYDLPIYNSTYSCVILYIFRVGKKSRFFQINQIFWIKLFFWFFNILESHQKWYVILKINKCEKYQNISNRLNISFLTFLGVPPWSNSSVLDHRSLPTVFESRRGHIWRLFHYLWRLLGPFSLPCVQKWP